MGGVGHGVGGLDLEAGLGEGFLAGGDVVALEADDEGDLEAEFQLIAVSKAVPTIYSGKPRGRMMVGAPSVLVIYSVDTGGDGEGLRRHLRHRL